MSRLKQLVGEIVMDGVSDERDEELKRARIDIVREIIDPSYNGRRRTDQRDRT